MATSVITVPVACNRGEASPGGVNRRDDSVGFGGRFSPYMKNMVVEPTRVRKRLGYSTVGANLPLSGQGTGLHEYVDARGTKHLIATTTLAIYEYDATTNLWNDISPVSSLNGDVDDVFRGGKVTDTSLFPNNGGSALVLTNNIDDLVYYEGQSGDRFKTLVHGYPSFASCVDLAEFWNHLTLLGVTDSAYNSRLIAWADFANANDWSGGTCGASVLTDSIGKLLRAKKLGNNLILYSDGSISTVIYGNVDVVFVIPTVVFGTGLLAKDAVWGDSNSHRFVGSDLRIYKYSGDSLLYRVGEVIEGALFSQLNYSIKQRMRVGYDPTRQKFFVFYPRAGDSYAKVAFAQSIGLPGEPWEYYEFAHDVCATSMIDATVEAYTDEFTYGSTVLLGVDGSEILDVGGSSIGTGTSAIITNPWANIYCDETTAYCDDPLGQEGVPVGVFISSAGNVYKLDESTGYDDTSLIECEYQTEDVTVDAEHSFGRWQSFSFVAKSIMNGTVTVSYSTDGGETWEDFVDSPVQLSSKWETYRLKLAPASERVRFKLYQYSSEDLQLRSVFRVEVSPGTARG